MFQPPTDQTIGLFPLLLGSLAILLGLFSKSLLRLLKVKPLNEVYTTPRFQRSARITERIGQLFLVVFGIGFLAAGAGSLFLSGELTYHISITILGASGLILLVGVGVMLANWKAK
jgi:hypothetical protein